jgi:hypothetical protein
MNIQKLIKNCGGATYVAQVLDMKPMAIYGWIHRGRIPMKRVHQLKEKFPYVITDEFFNEIIRSGEDE